MKTLLKNFEILETKSRGRISTKLVKEIFNIPTMIINFFLELAVRTGHVKKFYEIDCQTCKKVVQRYRFKYEIPNELSCCFESGHLGFHKILNKKNIKKIYLLNK